MNKKGFTLVELLAVIIILAIVLAIAIPVVSSLIENSKKSAFESEAKLLIKWIDYKKLEDPSFDQTIINETNMGDLLNMSNDNIETLSVEIIDGVKTIIIKGKEDWSGLYVCGTYLNMQVVTSLDECSGGGLELSVTHPELNTGMIPIYYDDVNLVWKKADETNGSNQWFDYDNQKWANVVLVTKASRATYQSAEVGTTINEADVLAYLVWIPRYKYKLFNVGALATSPQAIEVVFERKTDPKSTGSTNDNYLTHPAFTFGETELAGIWVGKFELTGNITTPTVKPNIISLRSQTLSTFYTTMRKIDATVDTTGVYGLTNTHDAHMMKNTEWGAVAYLSHSIYGKYGNSSYNGNNKEIYLNNSNSYYTGRSMGAVGGSGIKTPTNEYIGNGYYTYDGKCATIDANLPTPCNSGSVGQNLSDKTLAYGASTTGNIYGIYDISGGSREYVMGAQYNNDNTTINVSSTGFLQATIDDANMTKYIDKYTFGTTQTDQSAYNRRQLGDATGETRGWNGDYAYFIYSSYPWFLRGGHYYDLSVAGIFYFRRGEGQFLSFIGSRLIVS